MEVLDRTDRKLFSLSTTDKGVVILQFAIPNSEITYKDSLDIYSERLQLKTPTRKQSLLVDLRNNPQPDDASKAFAKSETLSEITRAMAMLVNSKASRIIGNFFVGLNRPPYPTRLFTDEIVALDWLERQELKAL